MLRSLFGGCVSHRWSVSRHYSCPFLTSVALRNSSFWSGQFACFMCAHTNANTNKHCHASGELQQFSVSSYFRTLSGLFCIRNFENQGRIFENCRNTLMIHSALLGIQILHYFSKRVARLLEKHTFLTQTTHNSRLSYMFYVKWWLFKKKNKTIKLNCLIYIK